MNEAEVRSIAEEESVKTLAAVLLVFVLFGAGFVVGWLVGKFL